MINMIQETVTTWNFFFLIYSDKLIKVNWIFSIELVLSSEYLYYWYTKIVISPDGDESLLFIWKKYSNLTR